MAKLYNLARMTTATVGTGTITLGVASSGFLTFALAGVSNGDVVAYGIKDGANSEIGTGTYSSTGPTLTRTVTTSTNSNAAISLSGTAEVFVVARKEDLLSVSESQAANTVLASPNGSSGAPSFRAIADADLPSGHWVLLNTLPASSSASLSDTTSLTSTYNEYLLVFESILPATNAVDCIIQVNSGGVQTSSYLSGVFIVTSSGGNGGTSATSGVMVNGTNGHLSNSGAGVSGEAQIFKPSGTASPKTWLTGFSYLRSDGFTDFSKGGGLWNGGNGAVTGFQVSMTSGNIASGTIKVYGRK